MKARVSALCIGGRDSYEDNKTLTQQTMDCDKQFASSANREMMIKMNMNKKLKYWN